MSTPARRLWQAIEPLHAAVYFAQEPADASAAIGLKGWWMGYVAGRLAPAGPLDAATGHALCFAFARRRIARALPDAWTFATPEQVLATRLEAVSATLRRALPGLEPDALVDLLEWAIDGCSYEGRALAAAWSSVPRPSDPVARLWLATTVLREHRGDGHVMAVAYHGLSGLDAGVTHVAAGRVSREDIQISRAWSDEEWEQATRDLVASGILSADGTLTEDGHWFRADIEAATDRLAEGPVRRLGEAGVEAVIELAAPLSRRLIDTGVVPAANPIGVPRP